MGNSHLFDEVMKGLIPVPNPGKFDEGYDAGYREATRRTIAAAEPHIRRKVLEELIAEAGGDWLQNGQTLADWLRFNLPVEP